MSRKTSLSRTDEYTDENLGVRALSRANGFRLRASHYSGPSILYDIFSHRKEGSHGAFAYKTPNAPERRFAASDLTSPLLMLGAPIRQSWPMRNSRLLRGNTTSITMRLSRNFARRWTGTPSFRCQPIDRH